ncbi:MAG: glutathione S-transferase N-terminal domain-containing protein [Pseudomonadota bacterium]
MSKSAAPHEQRNALCSGYVDRISVPVIPTKSKVARQLKGVHLYHYALSNCSQRCRLALEIKGIPWHSHHLNLAAKEHLTPDYIEINPNAVVPTLVHNGRVVIESNDIVDYIDQGFPGSRFWPDDVRDRGAVNALLEASSDVQDSIKTLSHEYMFQGRRQQTSLAEIAQMKAAGANSGLVSFLRDFVDDGRAWELRVIKAHEDVTRRLVQLNERINQTKAWLTGSRYGIADISWSVNYYRLMQCGVDMSRAPDFAALGLKLIEGPAFSKAVIEYRT